MQFYTPKKKPVNVPIIPLLDILAILLIYTVVAFQVKTDDKGKGKDGDKTSAAKNIKKKKNPRTETSRSGLKIETPSTDAIDTKTIKQPRVQVVLAADGRVEFNGTEIEPDLILTYLESFREQDPDGKLEIKADKDVTLQHWVNMLEVLKKAGIKSSDVPWLVRDKSKESDEPEESE